MKEVLSWSYETILTEEFGDKHLEIFEYRGKINVRIGGSAFNVVDTSFEDEQKGWEFFCKLVESFEMLK